MECRFSYKKHHGTSHAKTNGNKHTESGWEDSGVHNNGSWQKTEATTEHETPQYEEG
jgi:hypothetical protein